LHQQGTPGVEKVGLVVNVAGRQASYAVATALCGHGYGQLIPLFIRIDIKGFCSIVLQKVLVGEVNQDYFTRVNDRLVVVDEGHNFVKSWCYAGSGH
jgi:hypothetical protein